MIDFSVEPDFQAKLDWMDAFVRDECETMDLLWPAQGACYDTRNTAARAHLKPLQDRVRAQGLWACHLGPNLGGPGYVPERAHPHPHRRRAQALSCGEGLTSRIDRGRRLSIPSLRSARAGGSAMVVEEGLEPDPDRRGFWPFPPMRNP